MKWLQRILLVLLGIVIYAVCIDMFGGYPQIHSDLLNLIAVVAIILAGLFVWIGHERRDEE